MTSRESFKELQAIIRRRRWTLGWPKEALAVAET
jgi:hypothetical protein